MLQKALDCEEDIRLLIVSELLLGDPAKTLINKHASHVWSKVRTPYILLGHSHISMVDHGDKLDSSSASYFYVVCPNFLLRHSHIQVSPA